MPLTKRLVVNLVVFAMATAALVGYGLVDLLGNPFAKPMQISTVLPDASGLNVGFSVTLNGVDVGSVSAVTLVPGGARVVMTIDNGVTIPSDVAARVNIANALGEQEVDLIPRAGVPDPPLRNGATVPLAPDATPTQVSQVVATATRVLQAIPPHALNSLLAELSTALAGQAGNIRTITDTSRIFAQEFLQYQSQFKSLLASAPPVLDTLAADGPQLRQALANTAVLAQVLAQHRYDLVNLFSSGSSAFGYLGDLVSAERPNLACLIHDVGAVDANVSQPSNLTNLNSSLQTNTYFWNLIPMVTKPGYAASLFPGDPARANQPWLRTQLNIPPLQPTPLAYATPRTLPPTEPGAGCVTTFGNGVGPAVQAGYHSSLPESRLVPPPASESYVPGVDQPAAGSESLSAYHRPLAVPGSSGGMGLTALATLLIALLAMAAGFSGRTWSGLAAVTHQVVTRAGHWYEKSSADKSTKRGGEL